MGSHTVTFHPTQVNTPTETTARQAGTQFTYPTGMEGCVDLGDRLHTEISNIRTALDKINISVTYLKWSLTTIFTSTAGTNRSDAGL